MERIAEQGATGQAHVEGEFLLDPADLEGELEIVVIDREGNVARALR